jgi:hypothetical protein
MEVQTVICTNSYALQDTTEMKYVAYRSSMTIISQGTIVKGVEKRLK